MVFYLDRLENELLACLCSMLVAEGRPVCICQPYAGANRPPSNRCHTNSAGANGQAWLRRDTSATTGVGAGEITFAGRRCGDLGDWETVIELGIYRCISATPDGDGNPPSEAQYAADRDLFNADKQTLYQVLCCPAWNNHTMFSIDDASVDPIGPSGACGGSVLQIRISGDPSATEAPVMSVSVDADPADPTGYTARVSWNVPRVYVSGPAGGG